MRLILIECKLDSKYPHLIIGNLMKIFRLLIFFVIFVSFIEKSHAIDEILIAYSGKLNGEGRRGAQLGLEEANTQGKFLNLAFQLIDNPSDLQGRVLGGFKAVVSDSGSRDLRLLTSSYNPIPIFNIAERSEALRQECYENLLHVISSEEMLDDAITQWQRGRVRLRQTATGWHYSFKKYAAAQLNKRYEEKYNEPMSEVAWAGWASIKIISDTIARFPDSGDLLYSMKTNLKFDGQKGVSMTFRENGQLRQPVLIIEQDRVIGEMPQPGANFQNRLDDLGTVDCYK